MFLLANCLMSALAVREAMAETELTIDIKTARTWAT